MQQTKTTTAKNSDPIVLNLSQEEESAGISGTPLPESSSRNARLYLRAQKDSPKTFLGNSLASASLSLRNGHTHTLQTQPLNRSFKISCRTPLRVPPAAAAESLLFLSQTPTTQALNLASGMIWLIS